MRLHYLQHVHFETPGYILNWALENGVDITSTHFYEADYTFPELDDFDYLVVMGGPMGVYDQKDYPWLEEEKEFIQKTIQLNKPILGICLGAQLISAAMNASVYSGTKEIGWFPINKVNSGVYFEDFPESQTVLHWHGDTFDLPDGATLIASNNVTKNQAFEINNIIGLQFHFEMGPENVENILKYAVGDLTNDQYVQTKEKISSQKNYYFENKAVLYGLLNKLFVKK